MSRPGFPLFASCSVATLLLVLRPDSLHLFGLMVATSFVVMTLLAQCFSRVDVATTVSHRDLVCGLLPLQVSNLSRDLKVMSRPLFMFISLLLVATSILCCNQFPPSDLYSRSRPQGDVTTSSCSFSGRI